MDGLWERKCVILRDVDELDGVPRAGLVCSVGTGCFVPKEDGVSIRVRRYELLEIDVPKGHATVTLLELQLFFEGQVHGLGAHGKHLVYKFIRTMILQTVIIVSGIEQGKSSAAYSLPEAKSGGSFPKLVSLTDIAGLDELVVDN